MRFRLRTLLILLAIGPPLVAYLHWQYEHRPGYHLRQIGIALHNYHGADIQHLRHSEHKPGR